MKPRQWYTDDLLDAKNEIRLKEGNFLTVFGWKSTSNNPSSLVLWIKEIDGIVYCVNGQTAIRIESNNE